MFQQIVPLNQDRHQAKMVRPVDRYSFMANIHIASIMLPEFPAAAPVFPIVFLEQPGSEDFVPVTLFGFTEGENLFVDGDGKWTASYLPAMMRRYPFTLAASGEEGRYTVCVDEGSGLVGDEDGQALFGEDGEPGPVVESAKRFLIDLQQMEAATTAFSRLLKEKNMLAPLNLRVRNKGTLRNVTGCYAVNEERLNGLSDEAFLDLRKRQYLPAIYSHLLSLAQVERLVRAREDRGANGEGGS